MDYLDINNYNFIIFILLFIWITFGILSFILSIFCFIYDDNYSFKNIFYLFISSIFFGPFYWIYFIYINNYSKFKTYYKIIN